VWNVGAYDYTPLRVVLGAVGVSPTPIKQNLTKFNISQIKNFSKGETNFMAKGKDEVWDFRYS